MSLPRGRSLLLFCLLVLVGAAAVVPTPYWLVAPGTAVDLRAHVRVDDYEPSPDRFYLTDVSVRPATLLLAGAAHVIPGMRLIPRDQLIPRGVAPATYDRMLVREMDDSQWIAALVAERAVGMKVADPMGVVRVLDVLPTSRARGVLEPGDRLVEVAGRPVSSADGIVRQLDALRAPVPIPVRFERGDRMREAVVRPSYLEGRRLRLGIRLETEWESPHLPVPVHVSLGSISGSSGGLMLALQVYRTLRPDHREPGLRIAGTGTIALDGSVGPIEGTRQKLIAAEQAGVSVFFVPKQNYEEIAGEPGVRIIPVGSLKEALAKL